MSDDTYTYVGGGGQAAQQAVGGVLTGAAGHPWPFNPGAPATVTMSAREVRMEEFLRAHLNMLPKHARLTAIEILDGRP